MTIDAQRRRLAEEGFCVVPTCSPARELERVRDALDRVAERPGPRRRGTIRGSTRAAPICRPDHLPAIDPVFVDLSATTTAMHWVRELLGPAALISNFTANIALPGSGSMNIHSDQALVVAPAMAEPWACNVIWCLDDVH